MRKKHIIQEGKKYGRFVALKQIIHTTETGKTEKQWECIDDKGLIRHFRARFLTGLISQEESELSLKKSINLLVENNQHQMGIRNRYYAEYKGNAEKRKIFFGLSFKQFNSLIIKDCHYCGKEPTSCDRWDKMEHKGQPKLLYNGIDRVSSKEGYTTNNVVSCCSKCNLMKNIFETNEFLEHISRICNFNRKSSTTIPEGSTLQANGSGNGVPPYQEDDIV